MRSRIPLTQIQIRILPFTLMRIRIRILPFTLMLIRILIRILLVTVMRIRIQLQLSTLMRIRKRIQLSKMMRIRIHNTGTYVRIQICNTVFLTLGFHLTTKIFPPYVDVMLTSPTSGDLSGLW
jgi:hypothetical protein